MHLQLRHDPKINNEINHKFDNTDFFKKINDSELVYKCNQDDDYLKVLISEPIFKLNLCPAEITTWIQHIE